MTAGQCGPILGLFALTAGRAWRRAFELCNPIDVQWASRPSHPIRSHPIPQGARLVLGKEKETGQKKNFAIFLFIR